MKELLFVTALTLFVLSETRPGVVTQEPVEREKSINAEESHVRVRRGNFDYGEYISNIRENMSKCTNCNTVKIGNGNNNWNELNEWAMGTRQKSRNQLLDIGNGNKNRNTVYLRSPNSPNQNAAIIGNGSENTNTVYFGIKPGSIKGDPFTGSFWED